MKKPTIGDTLFIGANVTEHGFEVNEKVLIIKVLDAGTPYEHYHAKGIDKPKENWLVNVNDLSKEKVGV